MNQDYKDHMRRVLPVPSGLGRWKTATGPAGTTMINRSVGKKRGIRRGRAVCVLWREAEGGKEQANMGGLCCYPGLRL